MSVLAVLAVARWAHLVSLCVMFGAPLFWFYAFARPSAAPAAAPASFAKTRRMLRLAAPAALLSGLACLAAVIVEVSGDDARPDWGALVDPATLRAFFDAGFGDVFIARLAVLALAAALVARRRFALRTFAALSLLSALSLVSHAFLGHAAQGEGIEGATMICAYAIHILGVGAWIGALAPLLCVVAESGASMGMPRIKLSDLLPRFSVAAIAAVAAVLAGGLANAAFRLGSSRLPLAGAYGHILGVKLLLVLAMLALACFNRFALTPRLAEGGSAGRRAASALRASISIELAIGLLVVAAAALLGMTPPPD